MFTERRRGSDVAKPVVAPRARLEIRVEASTAIREVVTVRFVLSMFSLCVIGQTRHYSSLE